MSRRAIHLGIPAIRHHSPRLLLSRHSIPASNLLLFAPSRSPPMPRQVQPQPIRPLETTASLHTDILKPHTSEQFTRLQVYDNAKDAILKAWKPDTDPDGSHLIKALAALKEAHWPTFDAELREWVLKRERFRDQLDGIDEGLYDPQERLKPDAPWGLVVYRTSYRDGEDGKWKRIVDELLYHYISALEAEGRLDLVGRHRLVVMDDRARFGGVSVEGVQEHFRKWAVEELRRNWRVPPVPGDEVAKIRAAEVDWRVVGVDYSMGARYNFCLVVDDICMEALDEMRSTVVKLVRKRWWTDGEGLEEEEDDDCGENPGWEGGETNCDLEDVGWMYVEPTDYGYIQRDLQQPDDWEESYLRPPLMRWEDDFARLPGFWRRKEELSNTR